MKTFRKIGLAIMAVLACTCITSCGDDDDEDEPEGGNGSISATIDGEKLNLSNVFWWIDKESYTSKPNHNLMHIEFWSYNPTDPSSFPGYGNFLFINYDIPANVTDIQSVTIQSGDYHIYCAQNVTTTSGGWQGESIYKSTSDSPLVITRDGGNYTIKINHAVVSDEVTNKTISLNFSGPIAKLPDYLQSN